MLSLLLLNILALFPLQELWSAVVVREPKDPACRILLAGSELASHQKIFFIDGHIWAGLRPIRSNDKEFLKRTFRELSEESRYFRFLSPTPKLPSAHLAYLTEIDYFNHFAFVLVEISDHKEVRIIGVTRYIRDSSNPQSADMAMALIDEFQRRGLGTQLFTALKMQAQINGISELSGDFITRNKGIRTLLERLCREIHFSLSGAGVTSFRCLL